MIKEKESIIDYKYIINVIDNLQEKMDSIINNLVVLDIIIKSIKKSIKEYHFYIDKKDIKSEKKIKDIEYELEYNYSNINSSIIREKSKIYKVENELIMLKKGMIYYICQDIWYIQIYHVISFYIFKWLKYIYFSLFYIYNIQHFIFITF